MAKKKGLKFSFIICIFLIIVGLFVFMFSGENFKIIKTLLTEDLDPGEHIELIRGFGIRGSLALSLLSMLQVVLTVLPAEPVQVLAGIGYGLWHGALVCLIGVFAGQSLIFVLYKIFGDKLSEYFKKNIDIDFEKIRTSKRVAFVVLLLYFLPAIPYGLICFFSASIGFKYPRFILINLLGSIPSILIGVGMGHIAIAASWVLSVVIFAILLVLIFIMYLKRSAIFGAINNYVHRNQEVKSYKVKEPNKFIYFLCKVWALLFIRKLKYKHQKQVAVEKPCIVLCSHGSFIDFLYSGLLMRSKHPHYTVARLYFYNKWLKRLLYNMGAFPKSMFATDVESLKNCMTVLNDGGVLAMMPEARLSTVGEFEDIQDTTIKFIKKMGVPVYGIKLNGSYLANPKWGDKIRKKALIESEFTQIATAEELKEISQDELYNRIYKAISYNDFEWLKAHPELKYKSKTLAEGLENILYKCPKCGKEFTMQTEKRDLFCTECGLKTTLDDRYQFVGEKPFANFAEWYHYQKDLLKEEILSNPDYVLKERVTLKLPSTNGEGLVQEAGEGKCYLSRKGLVYKGTIYGVDVEKEFPMSQLYRLLFGAGVNFEIYEGKEIFFFVPKDTRSCVKWYIASEILKTQSENPV